MNGFQQEKCTNSLTGEDFVETSSQKTIDANVDQIYKNVSKEQIVESSLGKVKVSRKGLPGKLNLFFGKFVINGNFQTLCFGIHGQKKQRR